MQFTVSEDELLNLLLLETRSHAMSSEAQLRTELARKNAELAQSNSEIRRLKSTQGRDRYAAPSSLEVKTLNPIEEDAKELVKNNCIAICEGANMPCTIDAIKFLLSNRILFAPGKASNAGGVAVSGLEMSQNSLRMSWTKEEVDTKLKEIMKDIHDQCVHYGTTQGDMNYVQGANIAGFIKVADAMLDQGLV